MIEAKKYLKSFKARENKISLKIERVKALRNKLTSLSVPMDKEQVSHTKNVSIMADTIAKIADIEKEIDQQSSELVEAQNEAFRYLDQIPSESANYLINRYFVGMTITDIGRLTFSSERSTYRRVQNALAEFQAVLDRNDVVQ